MKLTNEQLSKSLEQKTQLLQTLTEEKDKLQEQFDGRQSRNDKTSSKPGLLRSSVEMKKLRKGARATDLKI